MVRVKIGSLFSGAAGLDRAVEAVFGGEVVWHSEVDPAASKALAYHYPNVPNLGDITKVDWSAVEPVDVLCGGFPCQDVSVAGKRAGIKDGTRSGLWSIFADTIDVLRPRYVVIENVRGLLNAQAHRDMESVDAAMGNGSGRPVLRAAGAVLGDLADLGYDAQWTTLAASAVGAPHRRERVFVVAHACSAAVGQPARGSSAQEAGTVAGDRLGNRGGERTPRHGWLTPHTPRNGWNEGRPEPARFERGFDAAVSGDGHVDLLPTPSCSDGGGGHLSRSGDRGGELLLPGIARAYGNGELLPTPTAADGNGGGRYSPNLSSVKDLLPTPEAKNSHAGSDYARMSREGSGGHDLVTALALLPTHAASDSTGGGSHPDSRQGHSRQLIDYALLDGSRWGKYAPAIARWESLTRPAPAPTEPNKNGNPRLSAAFSEWLMGWPEGWVTDPAIGISRNDQLRIVGNGVVTIQAIAALRWLLSVSEAVA